jgi:hypothetical protein
MTRVADEITAFHGSPHDFSAFATEHIGSGEGAQAYGRGLYFAENRKVAESYREALSSNKVSHPVLGDSLGMDSLDEAFAKAAKTAAPGLDQRKIDEIATNVTEMLRKDGGLSGLRSQVLDGNLRPDIRDAWLAALAHADEYSITKNPGSLYEVRVAASKDHLLDWDKPLKDQSPFVQDALRKQMGDANFQQFADKTGGEYVEYGLGNTHASDLMNAGIPGIKYLDQASRDAGDGSHNIVVFDQNLVRIARKNDQPLAVDTAKAVPEPPPQGVKQAEASIAKPEDTKALATQYGVDANTGAFKEEADITQLADEGRLTEQDVATMAQAHMDYEVADAYAEAIKSVAGCLI